MRLITALALGAALGGTLAPAARAADNASFTALRAQSFEVKAVTFMPPGSVGDLRGQTINASTVMITLQRERAVAVCVVPSDVWAYQGRLLDNDFSCQVTGDRF